MRSAGASAPTAASKRAVTVRADEATTADFTLRETAVALDEIVVTATRTPTRLRALGSASERVPEREALTRQLVGVRDALRLLPGAAVLTSGGDAPGMNAAISGVVRCVSAAGSEATSVPAA